jgi:hypothetical protein
MSKLKQRLHNSIEASKIEINNENITRNEYSYTKTIICGCV